MGRGGITSDILANAPPVEAEAGASLVSPPAGPLPEMPAVAKVCDLACDVSKPPALTMVPIIDFDLTFPSHGEFIEKVRHEVTAAGCHAHRCRTKMGNVIYYILHLFQHTLLSGARYCSKTYKSISGCPNQVLEGHS